ncbi:MAG: hypothetical protein EOP07_15000 [Proteobacteria bacterium]|nr:MAG: hypothetical protein EOP07_15000 [Pseudomonadota bacterium]
MMSRQVLILSYFFVLLTSSLSAQTNTREVRLKINESLSLKDLSPDFELKPKWSVGFRSQILTDSWRQNRLPLSTSHTPEHRQVLLNLWYPAVEHKNMQAHNRYFESDDPYTRSYLQAFDRYRRISLYQETFGTTGFSTNSPIPSNIILNTPQAFDRMVPMLRNAQPADGKFPLVFYHSGSQGGFEENAPLFELLAQQGIAVAAVIGPSEDGEIDSTSRSTELIWDDMNLASAALKQDSHLDLNRVALMGFSSGAQLSLNFALNKGNFAAAVLLDTTYEKQDFNGSPPRIDHLRQKGSASRTPMLVLSEVTGTFGDSDRFRIYNFLKHAPILFVDFGSKVSHDDFAWHGLINRAAQENFDRTGFAEAKQRYVAISKLTLDFLNESFRTSPDWARLSDIANKHLLENVFRRMQKGSSPEVGASELMTILEDENRIQSKLDEQINQGRLSEQRLSHLIQVLRYTESSAKALLLCKVAKNLSSNDRLSCATIALECDDLVNATVFVDSYLAKVKKPKKNARILEKVVYGDAHLLKAMIAKAKLKQR